MSRATVIAAASQTPVYGTLDFTARDTRTEFVKPSRKSKRARSESPPPSAGRVADYVFPDGYFTPTEAGTSEASMHAPSIEPPQADAPLAPRRSVWAWLKGLRLICC